MPFFWRAILLRIRRPPPALRVVVLLMSVLAYGSTGFVYFEQAGRPDLTLLDGLWYTAATVTTVGYGDLAPATVGGRLLIALPLMVVGIGLLGYVLSIAASSLVETKTKELHGMSEYKLEGHVLILNFPNVGKIERLLDELGTDPEFANDRPVVLIDEDLQELPAELANRGVRFVRGNPTREETLARASVGNASHAIVLSKQPGNPHSDDLNVSVTLALESSKRNIFTVVECVDYSTEELLRKAGCDAIVCTSRFDAHFLSHEVLYPGVQEVIEQLTSNLRGQQVKLTPYAGADTTFARVSDACQKAGHIAIGLRRDGVSELNVAQDARVKAGDGVISIGAGKLELPVAAVGSR